MELNKWLNDFIWGPWMLAFFLFVGAMFTVRTGFFQVRHLKLWITTTLFACFVDKKVRKTSDKHAISQFQSLCTVLAATLGTGNIAGVATAIVMGGPGAIFWMWISAFLGMMTIFAESVLGLKYRYKNEKGNWIGGAMVYMEKGLRCKWLAVIFAVLCTLASFGIGNMTQANSIATGLESSFGISTKGTAIVLMIFIGVVILGGIKRIASVTEKLVPFMAGIYMLGSIVVLIINRGTILPNILEIMREAFQIEAVGGGVVGYGIGQAMKSGISRGVFSNEAGLGSTVMANSAADTAEPVIQGMWGILEVFIDTIVMCTITALVILCSGVYNKEDCASYYFEMRETASEIRVKNQEDMTAILARNGTVEEIILKVDSTMNQFVVECDVDSSATIKVYNANETLEEIVRDAMVIVQTMDQVQTDDVGVLLENLSERVLQKIDESVTIHNGVPLTSAAFSTVFGNFGGKFISISILLFAFSTLLGWSFYGERAVEYLLGIKAIFPYRMIFVGMIFIGCTTSLELVWDIADTLNGFMAIPNLIAITLLSGQVVAMTRDYLKRQKDK